MLADRARDQDLGQDGSRALPPTAADLELLRAAAAPSPHEAEQARRRQEAAMGQQAAEASADDGASPLLQAASGSSSEPSEAGRYSDSDSPSRCSSPASSFTAGSMHSTHSASAAHGMRSGGLGWCPPGGMRRAATSHAPGGLVALGGAPSREVSSHLQARRVQDLVLALLRCFTAAYGPAVLVLEDLHHFDTASWRLLSAAVADEALHARLLLVLTYRPHFGALSPTLRQRPGPRERRYQRVQASYRALLSQVSRGRVRAWG
jgi:hypothetical protein